MALRLLVLAGFLVALGGFYTVLQQSGVLGEEAGGGAPVFADVGEDHPQRAAIEEVTQDDIMEPSTDDLFNPEMPITRSDFTMVVVKTMGWDEEVQADLRSDFTDVEQREFKDEGDYIALIASKGIMSGVSNDPPEFGPDQDLQTGHAIIVFVRAARDQLPEPSPAMDPEIEALPYTSGVEEALNVALTNDLLVGTGIDPLDTDMEAPITRAQVAALAANVRHGIEGSDQTSAGSAGDRES